MRPNQNETPLMYGIVQGVFFAVVWGAAMWFGVWRKDGMSIEIAIGAAVAAGVLFGIAMGFVRHYRNRKSGNGDGPDSNPSA